MRWWEWIAQEWVRELAPADENGWVLVGYPDGSATRVGYWILQSSEEL